MAAPSQGRWRWEDSAGLDHHCGTCGTVLSSPRAMNTCFGKHVEPCQRYHQQLHFIQKSHECFGCATADEMHIKRHREIARILQAIRKHDEENIFAFQSSCTKRSKLSKTTTTSEFDGISDALSQVSTPEKEPLTKRQRKEVKRLTKQEAKAKAKFGNISKEDIDFISEVIHQKIITGKGANLSGEEKNRSVEGEMKGVTPEILQNNIAFNRFQRNKFYGKRNQAIEAAKIYTPDESTIWKRSTIKPKYPELESERKFIPGFPDAVDPAILDRLGVRVHMKHDNSKKRKDLIKKLLADIKADLDVIEREDNETRIREAGFWRFVNKNTFDSMRELHEGFSWSTGELVKQRKTKVSEEHGGKGNITILVTAGNKHVQPKSTLTSIRFPVRIKTSKTTHRSDRTYAYRRKSGLGRAHDCSCKPRNTTEHDGIMDGFYSSAGPVAQDSITPKLPSSTPSLQELPTENTVKILDIVNSNTEELGWTRVANTRGYRKCTV